LGIDRFVVGNSTPTFGDITIFLRENLCSFPNFLRKFCIESFGTSCAEAIHPKANETIVQHKYFFITFILHQ
jgi:hypothetical protein